MWDCGKRIPASEHAVSVSLPTMGDVIGYERQEPRVMQRICSGYPRFVVHWMVQRVQELCGERVIALRDQTAVLQLCERLGQDLEVLEGLPFGAVRLPEGADAGLSGEVRRFLQHTGLGLSSRQAEDVLVGRGLLGQIEPMDIASCAEPGRAVSEVLAGVYGVPGEDVCLFPSGMAAFYSVFEAIDAEQRARGRTEWVQVGWLYLDSSALLERYAGATRVFGVGELAGLEAYLAEHHGRIAAVLTEVMTNPLLETTDLVALSRLCRRYDIPLIVDISMPTPVNVDVLGYADIVVESLTKFASGHADVMAGAAIFCRDSEWAGVARARLRQSVPYERDLEVLADHIRDYVGRMQIVNRNTEVLGSYFRDHRGVRRVHGASQAGSRENYDRVLRGGGGYGGVLSVVFAKPLIEIYDRLSFYKGPSFGTEFTLCMPYVYLAHYDLVSTAAGREKLARSGVEPELLRISVGMEPIGEIIAAFDAVL